MFVCAGSGNRRFSGRGHGSPGPALSDGEIAALFLGYYGICITTSYFPLLSATQIVFGSLRQLLEIDFGPPLHSLALCARHGDVNPVEMEVLGRHNLL